MRIAKATMEVLAVRHFIVRTGMWESEEDRSGFDQDTKKGYMGERCILAYA